MKKLILRLNSTLKNIGLIGLFLCFGLLSSAQWTYTSNYFTDAGNPGGVNPETTDATTTGWNQVVTGPQASNIWGGTIFLPFAFDFYGQPMAVCYASQNGLVTFSGNTSLNTPPNVNYNLPSINFADSTFGFWDEFTSAPPTGSGDNVLTQTFGTAPNRQFWIKWYSFEMGNPVVSFSYFSVVLEETTNKIYVVDQYATGTATTFTATVGVQLNSLIGFQHGDSLQFFNGNGTSPADNDYYEFIPELLVDDNAGISALDNPFAPLSSGVQNVDVTLKNYGSNNLDSVNIDWEVNGVAQTGLSWSAGPLAPLLSQSALNLGTYNFMNGFTTVKAWTSLPNGVTDSNFANDTLEVELCTALNGVYTVGGATPDFVDIASAVSALSNCGIAGPVTINITAGTYTGGYALGEIIGSSATNTITFNGGSAATTILTHDAVGLEAVWSLEGVDYLTLKNMTITNTGTTDAWGVHLMNASDYNTVDSCIFNMDPTPNLFDVIAISASASLTDDFAEGNNCNWCTFSNNQINYGEYGMHFEGLSTTVTSVDEWMNGINIINNVFDGVDDYNIYVDNQDSLTITGNLMQNSVSVNSDGIYCFDIQNFNISGNTIFANDYGIYVSDGNFDGVSVPSRSLISNNMVLAPADYALYLDDVNDLNVYHNTLNGEPAVYTNDLLNVTFKNNIFTSQTDYCFESLDTYGAGIDVDYNMYWTPSTNTLFVKEGTSIHANLVAWQGASVTLNANSIELEPLFFSPTDMHMTLANGNDVGDNSVGILTDIDGETRPQAPGVVVDMGADEWTPNVNDAGISSFANPFSPLSAGLQNVDVTLENYGLASLNSVNVEWTINGTPQTTLNWSAGPLASFTNTVANVGTYNFPVGFTTLKAWTAMPNGVTDQEFLNDTTEVILCTALNGVYTVGGATPDFTSIQEAVDALNNCGIAGTVTINITPGTYTGGYILLPISGASASSTVTFNGGDAATTLLTHDATGIEAVWSFQGADYVTLKNMTIENTGTTDAWGVHLKDISDYNIVDSCIFNMYDVAGMFDVAAIVASDDLLNDFAEGNNANYCTFSNNQINGGEYGIHLEGLSTSLTAVDDWMNGMNIINNVFNNVDDYNIYVDNQDSLTITGNIIGNSQSTQSDGIYCFDIQNFNISGNTINANDYGIYISDGNFDITPGPVPSQSLISNNMVSAPTDYALYLDDVNNVDIYHNTLSGSPALYMNDNLDMNIKNNIFTSATDYCFESVDLITASIVVDYNMYWTPSSNALFVKDGTNIHADLTAWQTANVTININSVELEPFFVSATDLHLEGANGNDIGDNAVGILVDIDGDTRPLAPSTIVDMGADEFTPVSDNAAFISIASPTNNSCGDSTTVVSIEVQNLGLNPITSLPITLIVGGDVTDTVNFTYAGNIPFGANETIAVTVLNTYAGGNFTIDGYLDLTGDSDNSNDTLSQVSLTFIPFEPSGYDVAVCGTNTATLFADSTYVFNFDWYDAPVGGNLVGSGTNYSVPSIASQSTYYLEYGAFNETLETTYADNNGCGAGVMFDINSTINTSISGFCVNSPDATITANVYYIVGSSYVGNETNSAAWTSAGTYTFPGSGTGNPSCFSVNTPITVPSGQTVAIYIDYNARYTNLSSSYTSTSGAITITTGAGFCNAFSGPINGRTFNGSVTFGVTPCSAVRVPVTASSVANVDLGTDTVSCGTAIDLDAGAANSSNVILWSTTETTTMITANASGEYYVEVTDTTAGCSNSDTINVVIDNLSVDLGADVTACAPASVTIDAGNSFPAMSYAWSTGATTQTIDVSTMGDYSVVVSDTFGCSDSDTVTVSVESISVDLGPDLTICAGTNASLDAGVGAASYAWSTGATTQTINASSAGDIDVTVTGPLGCTNSDTVSVQVDALATAGFTSTGTATNFTWSFADNSVNADSVYYDFGDGNFSSAASPTNTYAAVGTYTVCQYAFNDCNIDTLCKSDVVITGVGIRNVSDNIQFSLYPNPTSGKIALTIDLVSEDELTVQIYSMIGNILYSENLSTSGASSFTKVLNVSTYAQGTYLIKVTGRDGSIVKTFVKK